MGRHFLVSLGLLCVFPSVIQAQIAQQNSIVGPDGRGPSQLAPRPPQPTLEDQLRRKKKQVQEPTPASNLPEQPAMSADELLDPQEKARIAAMEPGANLPEGPPRFRMNLGLALAQAKTMAGPMDTWRFEPGAMWETAFRLTDPNKSFTFWTGWRLASWSGTASSSTTFARFATQYIGPLLAFEWQGTPRHNLAFGVAGFSRQTDQKFPGASSHTATKTFGLDGTGLWLTYTAGFRLSQKMEWETKLGVQSGASYLLTYVSLGVSLWTD